MSQRRFRTLHRESALLVGEFGPVCVAVWREQMTREVFEHQRAGVAHVVARNPGRAALLFVIEHQVTPPSNELRKLPVDMIGEHGSALPFIAGVVEASGFTGSVTRSVLSGMQLMAKRESTTQAFFSSVAEASKWLSERVDVDADELTGSVARKRNDQQGTGQFAVPTIDDTDSKTE